MSPAWRVGAAHLALALLVQGENCAHLAARLPESAVRRLALFAELPFLQLQNLAVAAALVLVAWLCAARPLLRLLPHLLLALLNALLIVDQLAWSVFLSHLDLDPGELPWASLASLGALRSSAVEAAGWQLALNLGAAVALGWWAWRSQPRLPLQPRLPPQAPPSPHPLPPPAAAGHHRARWACLPPMGRARWVPLVWAAAAIAVSALADGHHLQDHPLRGVLARALAPISAAPPAAPLLPLADLWEPRLDRRSPAAGEDAGLRDALARLRRLRRPNVLLVVLESVGARQLLPRGAAVPYVTPHLAELLHQGVAFTTVYTPFPGTTRAHLALETGGAVLTGGDFGQTLDAFARAAPYRGGLAAHLAALGYRTAVLSAGYLEPERLGDLLHAQGYHLLFDAGRAPRAWRTAHEVSSWGVEEDAVRAPLAAWLARPDRRPWFAQLLTISTHHPYFLPGMPPMRDGRRYLFALGHADEVLDRVLADLAAAGRLRDTVVLVTGDHGEAFGEHHPLNVTHRNFLYDENVRSFLLVLAPGAFAGLAGPVVSDRTASLGDLAPTLLDALGAPPAGMDGESLWPDAYRARIAYFSKTAEPAQWGLRDGRWKFIAAVDGGGDRELYDLAQDPDEQTNLAAARPAQAALYDRLCASWYASAGADLAARLRRAAPR